MINVKLLEYTPNPDKTVALAARQCYYPGFVGNDLVGLKKTDEELLNEVISKGHTSVLEHASFTFAIEGISRACSHQLVRYRIASFSQQSQRYVNANRFEYIIPESISKSDKTFKVDSGDVVSISDMYELTMQTIQHVYNTLIAAGVPAEDARYVLPNATETKLVMTMNARELLHFFHLRCCSRAQWEIRNLANLCLVLVKPVAPLIFKKAGPSCIKGSCPEGKLCSLYQGE